MTKVSAECKEAATLFIYILIASAEVEWPLALKMTENPVFADAWADDQDTDRYWRMVGRMRTHTPMPDNLLSS